jgi:hypothetical protein
MIDPGRELSGHQVTAWTADEVRARISRTILIARSRSSSGYFRCAGMTLHPSRDQSLQDPQGGPTAPSDIHGEDPWVSALSR